APGFDRAQAQALAALPHIAIGLHVTLTAPFRPLTRDFAPTRDGAFPPLVTVLGRGFLGLLDRARVAAEIAAQLAAVAAAVGRPPDFVDGHQHVQLSPIVRDTFLAAVQGAAPRAWVRQCGGVAGAPLDPKGRVIDWLSRRFRTRATALGIHTN